MFWGPDGLYGYGEMQGSILGAVGSLAGGVIGGVPGALHGDRFARSGFRGALDTSPATRPYDFGVDDFEAEKPPSLVPVVDGEVLGIIADLDAPPPPPSMMAEELAKRLEPILESTFELLAKFSDRVEDWLASWDAATSLSSHIESPLKGALAAADTAPKSSVSDAGPMGYSDFPQSVVKQDAAGNRYTYVWNTDPNGPDWVLQHIDYVIRDPQPLPQDAQQHTMVAPPAPPKTTVPAPVALPLEQKLSQMYGGHEVPEPPEPPSLVSIFEDGAFGGATPPGEMGAAAAQGAAPRLNVPASVPGSSAPDKGTRVPSGVPAEVDDWTRARQIFSGFLEGIPELGEGLARQAGRNVLYAVPIFGQGLLAYDIYEQAQRHGGGLGGGFVALNEMFNPAYGAIKAGLGAVDAWEKGDDRRLGNQVFHFAMGVLATAALLEGGGESSGKPGMGRGGGEFAGVDLGELPHGAGVPWKAIGERPSPRAERQIGKNACGPAVGTMVLRDAGIKITQQKFIEESSTVYHPSGGITPRGLESTLNELDPRTDGGWRADMIHTADKLDAARSLSEGGPWIASTPGHLVVVDGIDEFGNLMIRDSEKGTEYSVSPTEFSTWWTGVFISRHEH